MTYTMSFRILRDEETNVSVVNNMLVLSHPNITLSSGPPVPQLGAIAVNDTDLNLYYANGTHWLGLISSASGGLSISGTPVSGEVLTATSATTADWEYPKYLATTGAPVEVNLSSPPIAGQVLVATSPTNAIWETPAAAALGYGFFYGLTTGTGNGGPNDYPATIAPGAAVPFPRAGPATPDITSPSSTVITVANIGTYDITFRVHTTEPGQLQLALDTVPQPQTTSADMDPTSGGHVLVGNSIITTTVVDSIIQVINPAGNSTALTITPANGAETWANAQTFVIRRLA
jgi:hypothetical protein